MTLLLADVTNVFIPRFELVRDDLQQQMRARPRNEYPQYYLWDCVSLAFYVGEEVMNTILLVLL